ncbi:MAG TPA: ATP-binding protein [Polyangiales bacterium]|nr:ATP-binding protein [Polyangiales bacterium]
MSIVSRQATAADAASILIVEDQRLVAADLAMQLRGFGYTIAGFAVSGPEAIAKARELRPSAVLMDINLEGPMDGTEAALQIRSESDCAIVFLTAFSDLASLERAKLAEPGGYVVKPASPVELRAALEVALHKQKSERERASADADAFQDQLVHVQRRVAELEQAYVELEATSNSLTHDLRNPLQVIAGATEMIERTQAGQLTNVGKLFLSQVSAAADRMMNSLNGLLEHARQNASEPCKAELDLSALAREVWSELAERNPDARCEIAEGLTAHGERLLLRRVLENLLSNALKFTANRSAPRIEVGASEDERQCCFYVRDNGVGFPNSLAEGKLFRPYGRLHDPSAFAGNGLGLAGARRIIERHGGAMWAHGVEGQGATFYFTLPSA